MNKINGTELINLMFLPMTDNKIIEVLDVLGLEQPKIDEKYEIEECVKAGLNQGKGIFFTFREISGLSSDGEPILTIISFENDNTATLPYDLKLGDTYQICCDKLGKKADYYDDWLDENRIWKININNIECGITLVYTDSTLQKLDGLIIHKFNEKKIDDCYIPNKE